MRLETSDNYSQVAEICMESAINSLAVFEVSGAVRQMRRCHILL